MHRTDTGNGDHETVRLCRRSRSREIWGDAGTWKRNEMGGWECGVYERGRRKARHAAGGGGKTEG